MVSKEYKNKIRIFELEFLIRDLEPGATILEIGAGAGWQAQKLEERGFKVTAIDVKETTFRNVHVHEVIYYDGENIPFDNESFDVIFTSNVLEHIPHVEAFQSEIERVLKKDGKAIHFVPNFNWRLWTTLNHFPYVVCRAVMWPFSSKETSSDLNIPSEFGDSDGIPKVNKLTRIVRFLIPGRHGERGNVITEHYYFSHLYWKSLFKKTGWELVSLKQLPVFHSGNYFLGESVSVPGRHKLAKFLGGTTDIYTLRKK